jgi:chorismate dehydratase
MDKKIRVGAVNYLNAKPLIYGFEHGNLSDKIELILNYPSRLAEMLQKNKVDIALLPIASLPTIPGATIFSKYCIASDKQVASVALFSEVPIEEIQEVLLDYQSKTSVALFRILMRDYWHIRPSLLESDEHYISRIGGKRAGIIIGDRALQHSQSFPYVYDLAEAWQSHTQLPFVFATWVTTQNLSDEFIREFDASNALGLEHQRDIALENAVDYYDLNQYYTKNIGFELTDERRKGMQLFLNTLSSL